MTVGGDLNVSSDSFGYLIYLPVAISANGQTTTLGSVDLLINSGGSADTGTISGGNTSISVSASLNGISSGITESGAVTATSGGDVTLTSNSNADIVLDNTVGGTGVATFIHAIGSGNISLQQLFCAGKHRCAAINFRKYWTLRHPNYYTGRHFNC